MNTINVTPEELLTLRRVKNKELYVNVLGSNWVEMLVQVENGVLMRSKGELSDPDIYKAVQFANKPIYLFDERKPSHDFGNSTTWTTTSGSSEFIARPDAGKVFNVSHIQVRFPSNIMLTDSNKLCFQVWLWVDAYQATVPVMDLRYSSLMDLVWEANNTHEMGVDVAANLSSEKLIELDFRYCDPFTLEGAPIALHDCRGDYIRIWMEDHQPLLTVSGTTLSDPTWCVINGKETYDF